jgi:hypothetical protein
MHTIVDEAKRAKELLRQNIRTIQELLIHNPIDTMMIYAYVLNSDVGVISPLGEDLHASRRASPFVSPAVSGWQRLGAAPWGARLASL